MKLADGLLDLGSEGQGELLQVEAHDVMCAIRQAFAAVEGNPKKNEAGLAEQLQLGWIADREPDLKNKWGESVETAWVQERENQLVLLDTFFSALRPEESLCFFYAKCTPLSEQTRRVIVGVGRVLSVGEPTEYA